MSDLSTAAADVAVAAGLGLAGAQTPPAQPTPAPEKPTGEHVDPAWLPSRLARARNDALKDLGFEDADKAREYLKRARERDTAEMSELDRLKARNAELETKAKHWDEHENATKAEAMAALNALSPEDQEWVSDIAGSNPRKIMKAIEKLKSMKGAPAAPAPKPELANTTVSRPAPKPADPHSENHVATWERLKLSNPFAAAQYYTQNYEAIALAQGFVP